MLSAITLTEVFVLTILVQGQYLNLQPEGFLDMGGSS